MQSRWRNSISGSEFQICEAATGKARPQMVEIDRRYVQAVDAGRVDC